MTEQQTKYDPRSYQINARDQIINGIENGNKSKFLILLPTGMGKTLIATLSVDVLIERGIIQPDDKILFLVQDRKLKHQLLEMARMYGLTDHGHLFLLENERRIPAKMCRQHASVSKMLFATPQLLMNAVVGKVPRIDRATIDACKVIIIDEILDVFAQSYGARRPRNETVEYIEHKFGDGKTFKQIINDLKTELESSEEMKGMEFDTKKLENYLIREFGARNYRMSKKFEPVLNLLGLLDQSDKIVIGMTASISQETKVDVLKKSFGADSFEEIHPIGDDFESFKPAYKLRQIRIFDDWITQIDELISTIKYANMMKISKAYLLITNRRKIPSDRVLLFITDLLGKKTIQDQLLSKIGGDAMKLNSILANASAYLTMTVARQRLLESTFVSFQNFVNKIKNNVLVKNDDFIAIKNAMEKRAEEVKGDLGEKEKKILFWIKKFVDDGQKILVMCRFVEMTTHLKNLVNNMGIPATNVHGGMDGSSQHAHIMDFKTGDKKVLFASERLIEKGTDLPEADVGIYYGTTSSLERYEQSLGRIRSNFQDVKTCYTISYNQTVENEKSLKRDAMFLELMGKKIGTVIKTVNSWFLILFLILKNDIDINMYHNEGF